MHHVLLLDAWIGRWPVSARPKDKAPPEADRAAGAAPGPARQDFFLQHCLNYLGVGHVEDFNLISGGLGHPPAVRGRRNTAGSLGLTRKAHHRYPLPDVACKKHITGLHLLTCA
jgi:hypothetical protein